MRPRTRGDCVDRPRPCPWASCRWHAVQMNRGVDDVEQLTESCVLDIADDGGATLDRVGELLGIVGERVRQVEQRALAHLQNPRRLRMLGGAL